jgi:hypothetical protein
LVRLTRSAGAMAQPDRLLDAGNGRPWWALRRGKRKGKGSRRTESSPGTRRGGRLGRRMAGVDEFRRRRSSFPARYPRRWRRFRSPRLDSLNGEVEDGDGDLLSTSEERGGARNGGARRRAPATVSHERERVTNGEEREGRPGDRKKGRRGRRGIQGSLQGGSSHR